MWKETPKTKKHKNLEHEQQHTELKEWKQKLNKTWYTQKPH